MEKYSKPVMEVEEIKEEIILASGDPVISDPTLD